MENGRLIEKVNHEGWVTSFYGWLNRCLKASFTSRLGTLTQELATAEEPPVSEASEHSPDDPERSTEVTPRDHSRRNSMDPHEIALWGDVYVGLATRRTAFDTLIWQTPALGLTAQAFLLTIALSPDSSHTARYIAALLALITALVAIQTMTKHRYNERTDARLLETIERMLHLCVQGQPPHMPPSVRGKAVGNVESGLSRFRSIRLWLVSLSAFAVAAIAVVAITAINPGLLSGK